MADRPVKVDVISQSPDVIELSFSVPNEEYDQIKTSDIVVVNFESAYITLENGFPVDSELRIAVSEPVVGGDNSLTLNDITIRDPSHNDPTLEVSIGEGNFKELEPSDDGQFFGIDTATAEFREEEFLEGPFGPILFAWDDAATTSENNSESIDVLANDFAPDNSSLTVSSELHRPPDHGSVTIDGDGELLYEPDPGFSGADSFVYQVENTSDGEETLGASDFGTVRVEVEPDPEPAPPPPPPPPPPDPAPDDDTLTIAAGASSGNLYDTLLANDSDTTGIAGVQTADTAGRVAFDGTDARLVYTATGFADLTKDETATDSFRYTAENANGTDTATVDITVEGRNDAPRAQTLRAGTDEDSAATLDLLAAAEDPEGDAIALKRVGDPRLDAPDGVDFANGPATALTVADGTATLATGTLNALPAGEEATVSFDVTYRDEHGAERTQTAEIAVTGLDDAPVWDELAAAGDEDDRIALDVGAAATDPDAGETWTLQRISDVNAELADASATPELPTDALAVEGGEVVLPAGSLDLLAADDVAAFTFDATVSGGAGGPVTRPATLTVAGANDAPTAVDDVSLTLGEDETANLPVGELASDVDRNADLTIQTEQATAATLLGTGAPFAPGADPAAIADDGQTLRIAPGDAFQALTADTAVELVLAYDVADESGSTTRATLTATINGANDDPNAVDDTATLVPGSTVTSGELLANDTDPDRGTDLALTRFAGRSVAAGTQTTVRLDSGAEITVSTAGTFTYARNGAFPDLAAGETATETIAYRVADGTGGTSTGELDLVVIASGGGDSGGAGDGGREPRGDRAGDFIAGGSTGDTLTGGRAGDELQGGGGNDTIRGNDPDNAPATGGDFIAGGTGSDRIIGSAGDDTLIGGDGRDAIQGGAGDDTMSGGTGNDILFGEAGDDTLAGGVGNDYLMGGPGADRFQVEPDQDIITIGDFAPGTDVIDIAAFLVGSDAGTLTDLDDPLGPASPIMDVELQGFATVISLEGTTLHLRNLRPSDIFGEDFG